MLQLMQDEMRHEEGAFQESGLAEVGDAAVDDDAGIQNLHALAEGDKVPRLAHAAQFLATEPRAHGQAQVGQPQQKHEPADMKEKSFHVEDGAAHPLDQPGEHQPRHEPGRPAHDDAERGLLQRVLARHDEPAGRGPEGQANEHESPVGFLGPHEQGHARQRTDDYEQESPDHRHPSLRYRL